MDINVRPKPYVLFSALHLFFIITAMQIGVGLPGFQRIIFKESNQDAWISVILAGLATHFIVMIMVFTLKKYDSADVFGIHHDIYGKWIGKMMSTVYIVYFTLVTIVVFRAYIEMVHAWLFPELPAWLLALLGAFIIIYSITGGVRVVVGVAVMSFLLTFWMVVLLYFPTKYANWIHLLPIFDTPVESLLKGAYKMSFTIMGFELLYIFYPFIKEKEKAAKYTHFGLLYTWLLYTVLMIISIAYLCGDLMLQTVWTTFTMFKIIQIPFMERFEIIAISLWMIIILPNATLPLWAASRGIKRVYGFNQKYSLYILSIIVIIAQLLIKTRDQANRLFDFLGNYGFYLVFIYPIILYILVVIVHKKRQKRGLVSVDKTKSSS